MKVPSIEEAKKLIEEAAKLNPGPWIDHNKTAGMCARLIAEKSGVKKISAQAVGGAAAHNPVLIIVPCHRVVACDGSLTGYAGGIDIKEKLLRLEKADMSNLVSGEKICHIKG